MENQPKTDVVKEIVAKLRAMYPDARFGGMDGFDKGEFFIEMFIGDQIFVIDKNTKQEFGVGVFDNDLSSFGSYYTKKYADLDTAIAEFIRLAYPSQE